MLRREKNNMLIVLAKEIMASNDGRSNPIC